MVLSMAAKTNGISFPIWICSNGYALGINAWGVFSHISFEIILTGYKSRLRMAGIHKPVNSHSSLCSAVAVLAFFSVV